MTMVRPWADASTPAMALKVAKMIASMASRADKLTAHARYQLEGFHFMFEFRKIVLVDALAITTHVWKRQHRQQ